MYRAKNGDAHKKQKKIPALRRRTFLMHRATSSNALRRMRQTARRRGRRRGAYYRTGHWATVLRMDCMHPRTQAGAGIYDHPLPGSSKVEGVYCHEEAAAEKTMRVKRERQTTVEKEK